MGFSSWLRSFSFSRAPHSRAHQRRVARFRPAFEALEDRWMPSTLHVTSTLDDGSAGTLRAAIVSADKGDTIVFDASASSGTIYLNGSELLLDKSLTITGPAASTLTISGQGASRVFEVAEKANVRLEHLTISHGRAVYNGDNFSRFGSGILSYGSVTLNNCALRDNGFVSNANEAGGAIFNVGTLVANSCEFTGNVALFGGAIYNASSMRLGDDPHVWNDATMTLHGCLLQNNLAADSGGAVANWGTLRIDQSWVTLNAAGWGGGGILNAGVLTVNDSIVNGNFALVWGGGIFNWGTATLNNCIIASNAAYFGGGGLMNVNGTMTVSDSLVTGNFALTGGGVYSDSYEKLMIRRSAVGGNIGLDAADVYAVGGLHIDQQCEIGVIGP